ncbi:MAG: SIR2 family protein [Syntrophomonas sp.]
MVSVNELIRNYSKAVREGYAAVFAGAGLSRASGFVDWKTLLKPLARDIGLNIEKEDDLLAVAQYHRNERGTRASINQAIVETFNNGTEDNENINILTRLPINTYWTTNYDQLLENGLRCNNRKVEVKIDKDQLAITLPNRDAVLYKMHGDVERPADAVLTKDDYERYDIKRPLFRTALQGDLISKTFLFVGFSFEDPNLDYILSRIHTLLDENKRDHYCFFKRVQREQDESEEDFVYRKIKQDLREKDLRRYGIQAVFVNKYEEITDILRDIEIAVYKNNIFISGSAEQLDSPWNKEDTESFAYHLARELVKRNYKITTGFGLGIGSSIINGALNEIYATKYKHIDEYLCLRPFPQGIIDLNERKALFTKYRQEMLAQVGIAIFMFGNKEKGGRIINADGCWEEYEIAKSLGKIIIPLGSTGYAAKEILEDIKKNINDFSYLKDYVSDLESIVNPKDLVNLIVKIVDSVKEY